MAALHPLIDALQARSGLICLVGAGGKKSTLYRLAALHPGRVGVTATVYTPPHPASLDACEVIADAGELLAQVVDRAATVRLIAFACPSDKLGRRAGITPAQAAAIHAAAGFDLTLIKADGARTRWLKAPAADEPQIPADTTTVIPVISARAIGRPLGEGIAHRIDRIGAIIGAKPGDIITPAHIARLLASAQGGLKDVGAARVVPLINGVDNAKSAELARQAAHHALALSARFDRVVLTCMKHPEQPLVDVIER